jgi:hypothetical protein
VLGNSAISQPPFCVVWLRGGRDLLQGAETAIGVLEREVDEAAGGCKADNSGYKHDLFIILYHG